jgi:hypothetical protein
VKKLIGHKWLALLLLSVCALEFGCSSKSDYFSIINLAHLDHLYQEIKINNKFMAIIHIYAEHPEYEWKDAPGEGMACIDDVSRAAVFYLNHYSYTEQYRSLQKARKLLDFVLYMQASNGLFYNFINSDLSINRTHKNSIPSANWWSWRAVWALAEAYEVFREGDPQFSQKLIRSIEKTFPAIDSVLQNYPVTKLNAGLIQPTWLPHATAADQSAVLLLGLIPFYEAKQDTAIRRRIDQIEDGLMVLQVGDSTRFPYGAFLSWRNMWHAYGNLQAYALLRSGEETNEKNSIKSALGEIKFFYPYLMERDYLNQFTIEVQEDSFAAREIQKFSQIAYGIRPMVWASLRAHHISAKEFYARQAAEIACWLLGKNITGRALYDPKTGRCFDGIEDFKRINENSGAESTIEALLTILEVENNNLAKTIFHDYYRKRFHRN